MSNHTPHILVAEDNSVLLQIICFHLQAQGWTVTAASDGREAIEQLRQTQFDLLVTDYQMPFIDGLGICAFVRDDQHNHEMPIILCSAKGLELDTSQIVGCWNIAKVFFKPFSVRAMVLAVSDCLNATLLPTSDGQIVSQ